TDPSSYSACAGSDATSPKSDYERIWAVMRGGKGKRFAENERTNGRIPGFVFDLLSTAEKDHMLISMDRFQIQSLWSRMGEEKLLVTVFTMEILDEWGSQNLVHKLPVLPRRINYDKCGNICNMGFAKAFPGTKMRLDTPVHIFGEEGCIGVKKGAIFAFWEPFVERILLFFGYLLDTGSPHKRALWKKHTAEELYPSVKVDITMMDIGDRVCLRDLDFEVPLHSSNEPSLVLCEVVEVEPSSSELSTVVSEAGLGYCSVKLNEKIKEIDISSYKDGLHEDLAIVELVTEGGVQICSPSPTWARVNLHVGSMFAHGVCLGFHVMLRLAGFICQVPGAR
ncbi:hypothetical protein L7F22_037502, partial [Adiantum nelumboides]|nr:hypothetical protein [Adiantum nelumboides]